MKRISAGTAVCALLCSALVSAETYQLHVPIHGLKKPPPPVTFTSHTFTNCGQSGNMAPSITQCHAEYSGMEVTKGQYNFNVSDGIQHWTVPVSGDYRIEARGAWGGKPRGVNDSFRGEGAVMEGLFSLIQGDKLRIVVGQEGKENGRGNNSNGGGPGGGGSFVWVGGDTLPLIAAGGGGGSSITNTSYSASNLSGVGGTTDRSGTRSKAVNLANNGTGGASASYSVGAKGWNTMLSTLNFTGRYHYTYDVTGGFGGGGLDEIPNHAGGGGGGYSGGGGARYGGGTSGGNADGR